MQPTPNGQLFYIYNEFGKRIGIKDRKSVHHDGDWHRGVQLNLYHNGQLLIQRRSQQVDIARGLLDQSLATQLLIIDRENDLHALRRGLMEELHIDIDSLHIEHIAGPKRIIKYYEYDISLCNKEFVALYRAEIGSRRVKPSSNKVESLNWMPIDMVKKMAKDNPMQFTKTFIMWLREAM